MELKFLYLNFREDFVKFHDITNQVFHWNCTESTEQLGVTDVFTKMTIHLCQSSSAVKYYHFYLNCLQIFCQTWTKVPLIHMLLV